MVVAEKRECLLRPHSADACHCSRALRVCTPAPSHHPWGGRGVLNLTAALPCAPAHAAHRDILHARPCAALTRLSAASLTSHRTGSPSSSPRTVRARKFPCAPWFLFFVLAHFFRGFVDGNAQLHALGLTVVLLRQAWRCEAKPIPGVSRWAGHSAVCGSAARYDCLHPQCCDEMFILLAPGSRSGGKGGPAAKGGASKQTAAGVSIRQLEDEDSDAPMKLQTVSMDLRLALAQARAAKGLSQKDFAQKLNIPATVIQDYESGKAIPNNGLIAKMERALGAKLPRNK
jgi:DNA-binding transcriptional regulator YiaG